MTDQHTSTAEILIVEDERTLADVFETWLADEYAVQTAYTGEKALEALHPGIEVVLLDRRLPGISGETVLEHIREREIDCRVAILSAVEPDEEILELDIDEYLWKPVSPTELEETVESLARRRTLKGEMQSYLAERSKEHTLESA